jgi:hypothetical protein
MGWTYAAIYHHHVRQQTVETPKKIAHKEQHVEVQLAYFTWLSSSPLLGSRRAAFSSTFLSR